MVVVLKVLRARTYNLRTERVEFPPARCRRPWYDHARVANRTNEHLRYFTHETGIRKYRAMHVVSSTMRMPSGGCSNLRDTWESGRVA